MTQDSQKPIVNTNLYAKARGRIYGSALEAVGGTPLVAVPNLQKKEALKANLLLKLEFFNPMASVKDRLAKAMIEDAEARGLISAEKTHLIEPTSGNTGLGLALVAASKGYKITLLMPESASVERRAMMGHLGANLVLTPASEGMSGAIKKAESLLGEDQNGWMPSQFTNPVNPLVHVDTTGQELWTDTEGKIDAVVAGIGTGGTISGIAKILHQHNPQIKIFGVEPEESHVLTGGKPGPHGIQGIGAGFKPEILDLPAIEKVLPVTTENALKTARLVARTEGIASGISGGAAVFAAMELARQPEWAGKVIAVIIPDFAGRYLSTALFEANK
ncbi:cysteine synthase A [Acetobacteraceae bacterium]|nr:cysteine synthase A [Acetobacteraceae bacterium]